MTQLVKHLTLDLSPGLGLRFGSSNPVRRGTHFKIKNRKILRFPVIPLCLAFVIFLSGPSSSALLCTIYAFLKSRIVVRFNI